MKRLIEHQIIAWDFDDTLIGHVNSHRFHHYIRNNPQQEHHIVTFRDDEWATMIERDLEEVGLLKREDFTGVHNFLDKDRFRGIILNLNDDPTMNWKGLKCSEIGATILIDDMTDHVIKGCDKHGIIHIHPDDLDL